MMYGLHHEREGLGEAVQNDKTLNSRKSNRGEERKHERRRRRNLSVHLRSLGIRLFRLLLLKDKHFLRL